MQLRLTQNILTRAVNDAERIAKHARIMEHKLSNHDGDTISVFVLKKGCQANKFWRAVAAKAQTPVFAAAAYSAATAAHFLKIAATAALSSADYFWVIALFEGAGAVTPDFVAAATAVARAAAKAASSYESAAYSAFDVALSHTRNDIANPTEWRRYVCDYAALSAHYSIEAAEETIAAKEQMRHYATA